MMELEKDPPALPDPVFNMAPAHSEPVVHKPVQPRTYSIYAAHPVDGVVGGVLIDHSSVRISCSVLVTKIMDVKKATVTFEIRPRDGGMYTHHLEVEENSAAVANVSIKVPASAVKVLADDYCHDIYVTITAYPEGSNA